jgi:2-methylisocitrate lyase-like PEP mutase family enzyme
MNKGETLRLKMRELLSAGGTLTVPGAHDPVSARLIEQAGFPAVYIGSYATSAARLGQPDVGIVTMDDMVAHAGAIVDTVDIPVLADAENGWNTAPNIWRTVQSFEKAGVSGIHIEDHEFGKHTSLTPVIASREAALAKLRAAMDARRDPNFLIIARTDAIYLLQDVEEGITRLNAYTDAGADLVMAPGLDPQMLNSIRPRIKGKLVTTDMPGFSREDEAKAGIDIVLYYGFTLYAAYAGVRAALAQFKQMGSADLVPVVRDEIQNFEDFIGYAAFVRRAREAGLS